MKHTHGGDYCEACIYEGRQDKIREAAYNLAAAVKAALDWSKDGVARSAWAAVLEEALQDFEEAHQ